MESNLELEDYISLEDIEQHKENKSDIILTLGSIEALLSGNVYSIFGNLLCV
jgi:hypothetical protein